MRVRSGNSANAKKFNRLAARNEVLFQPGKGATGHFSVRPPGTFVRQRLDAVAIGAVTRVGHDTCRDGDAYLLHNRRSKSSAAKRLWPQRSVILL